MSWTQTPELTPDWQRPAAPRVPWLKDDPSSTETLWDEFETFWDVVPGIGLTTWDTFEVHIDIWTRP